ncbi:MAG: putative transcriptional regulator [Herbinix sp.]|jgi:transcriptional regulator with XRE-family HTH domain|nr:putative transcriptional regulator [Herbinix sp.]
MIEFAEKLRELRNGRNMSQKDLADRLGIDKSLVSYYESASRFPSPEILIKISRIFRVSIDYLLNLEKSRTLDISDLKDNEINALLVLIDVIKNKN